jgi:hypothetical protein
MKSSTGRRSLVAAVAGALVCCVAGAFGGSAPPAFQVRSTLDGLKVLPHRIHWVGRVGIPKARVAEVAFLIDGTVRWTERLSPYTFAGDGGYLVTTWLTPGQHRFAVRVRSTSGRTVSDTVVARVIGAPSPPAALAGSWHRYVPKRVGSEAPGGVWTITFDRHWLRDQAPGKWSRVRSQKTGAGRIVDNDWVPGAKTFQIAGGVTTGTAQGAVTEGDGWCGRVGRTATYSWSVSGGKLTLAPAGGHDACRVRGDVYAGTWTRAR